MSFQAMTWAMNRPVENVSQRMVLLMLANHSNLHTGQCNPSHKLLATECVIGLSTLKRCIQALQDMGYLTIINKYADGVQLPNQYKLHLDVFGHDLTGWVSPERAGGQSTAGGGASPQRATNLEIKPVIQPQGKVDQKTNPSFDLFWAAYPKRIAKDAAKKAFASRNVTALLLEEMLSAIAKQKNTDQWKKDNGQFIPNPASWLNAGRWQDEVVSASAQSYSMAGVI